MNHRHDICLGAMRANHSPLTADAYCLRNYGMDYEDLCAGEFPEWLAETNRLISDGELFVETGAGEYRLAIPEEE